MLVTRAELFSKRMQYSPARWQALIQSAKRGAPCLRCHLHIKLLFLLAAICFISVPFWPSPVDTYITSTTPDVVGVAVKPTCTSQRAIQALNQHVRPANIHVITSGPAQCAVFNRMASNVVCHNEYDLLPGVNHSTVADYLQRKFGSADSVHRGRKLAGWYLQQFLKLGAASAIPHLSEHFVIWDLDMILLRPINFLEYKQGTIRTAVNRGGARNIPGYVEAYRRLTGNKLAFAPDGSSFVTHWMVVYKPFMKELLDTITHTQLHLGQASSDDGKPHSRDSRRLKLSDAKAPKSSTSSNNLNTVQPLETARLEEGLIQVLNATQLSSLKGVGGAQSGEESAHVRERDITLTSAPVHGAQGLDNGATVHQGSSAQLSERGDSLGQLHDRQPGAVSDAMQQELRNVLGSLERRRAALQEVIAGSERESAGNGGGLSAHEGDSAGAKDFKAAVPWVWKILDAVPPEYVNLGFSEYASYVSFVKARHPETQFVLPRRSWLRTPGGAWLVTLLRRFHPQGCCCPCEGVLRWLAVMGYHYTGFETGHVESCDFTNPKYELAYCLNEDALLQHKSTVH